MWGDEITPHALELCSELPMEEVRDIERRLAEGTLTGLSGKMFLAKTVITDLHGADAVGPAEEQYKALTSREVDLTPEVLTPAAVTTGQDIIDVLVTSGLASSRSNARRLVEGNGVRVDGETVDTGWQADIGQHGSVLQVGKKKLENHRVLRFSEKGTDA